MTNAPLVLVSCPTWSGCAYALPKWAAAYHAQTYPNKAAFQVDNSDGPQTGGNLHYLHVIRGYDIPAVWQHTRWPALWDTLELSWRIMVERAHDIGAAFIFSVEADVIIPPEATQLMVDAAYAHGEDGKPAVVTQRYHPRSQDGPNFYWDTLGCSLFPVEPLYEDRDLVKAIYEIEVFTTFNRHGHKRYRAGTDGPDLFEVEHLKDPSDPHLSVYGATPAPTAYLKRVMEAQGKPWKPQAQAAPATLEVTKGDETAVAEQLAPAAEDSAVKEVIPEEPTIPIGTAHLPDEQPPDGADLSKPYGGRREAADRVPAVPLGDIHDDELARRMVMEEDRLRLNIGSDHTQISGFKSVDFNPDVHPDILADAKDLHMVETDSVDEIYASHVLEHLTWADGLTALKEWLRVLKPGGMLTVAVPDIVEIYHLHKHGATWGEYHMAMDANYVQAVAFGANLLAEVIPEMKDLYGGPGHKHNSIYLYDMLLERVMEAGFVFAHEVRNCFLRNSALGERMVEARKPLEGE